MKILLKTVLNTIQSINQAGVFNFDESKILSFDAEFNKQMKNSKREVDLILLPKYTLYNYAIDNMFPVNHTTQEYKRHSEKKKVFENINIVGTRENAGCHLLLLLSQCFISFLRLNQSFQQHSICSLLMLLSQASLKICRLKMFLPFPNKPLLLRVCSTGVMKTLRGN